MKKIFAQLFLFFIVFISLNNFCNAQTIAQRKHLNIDTYWKFQLGNAADPSKDFNYSVTNIFSKTGKGEGTAIANKFNDFRMADIEPATRLGGRTSVL